MTVDELAECSCGHADDEHVHYCAADVAGPCPCNAEYARLAASHG
jgi:hypothetical protein